MEDPYAQLKKEHNITWPNYIEGGEVSVKHDYQKGVDVALVTELLRMAREDVYDIAIVASGDSDFSSAVDCVKSMGR